MKIIIVKDPISTEEVRVLAKEFYSDMVKGVADVERGIIALGGEYHIDASEVLLKDGSQQDNLWGFNIYLDQSLNEKIEYISLINIRPEKGNRGMFIEDPNLEKRIHDIISKSIIGL